MKKLKKPLAKMRTVKNNLLSNQMETSIAT